MPYKQETIDQSTKALAIRISESSEQLSRAEGDWSKATRELNIAAANQEVKGGSKTLLEKTNAEQVAAERVAHLRRQIAGFQAMAEDAERAEAAALQAAAIKAVNSIGKQRLAIIKRIEENAIALVADLREARELGKEITGTAHVPGNIGSHLHGWPVTMREFLDSCFQDLSNGHLVDLSGGSSFGTIFADKGLYQVESARWRHLLDAVKAVDASDAEAA